MGSGGSGGRRRSCRSRWRSSGYGGGALIPGRVRPGGWRVALHRRDGPGQPAGRAGPDDVRHRHAPLRWHGRAGRPPIRLGQALCRVPRRCRISSQRSLPGEVIATGLACHRRPGCKPCSGKLLVRRAEAAARIEWACPACSDEGVISGWEGSQWDLSPALATDDHERVALLSIDQYGRLLGRRLLDTDSLRVVYAARRTDVGEDSMT